MLAATCSCPDHETRRVQVQASVGRRVRRRPSRSPPDGSAIVTETVKVTRKTYAQDWPAYNAAQCAEKATVQSLLRGLCDGIVTPPQQVAGRPPNPLSRCRLRHDHEGLHDRLGPPRDDGHRGVRRRRPHGEGAPLQHALRLLRAPELTPLLTALVEESAAPLACVESQFAVDSTGFGTVTYRRWYDHKYGREMKEHGWVKAHAMVGTTTNVITAIRVTDSDANDSPELPALVATTAQRFDDGRGQRRQGVPLAREPRRRGGGRRGPLRALQVQQQGRRPGRVAPHVGPLHVPQAEFLAHYHARSNVESTFGAMKRKFGASVRSKNPDGAGERGALQGALLQPLDARPRDARAGHRAELPGLAVAS